MEMSRDACVKGYAGEAAGGGPSLKGACPFARLAVTPHGIVPTVCVYR